MKVGLEQFLTLATERHRKLVEADVRLVLVSRSGFRLTPAEGEDMPRDEHELAERIREVRHVERALTRREARADASC